MSRSVILSEPSETVAPLLAQQTIQPRVEWTCFSFVHPVENFAPNQQSVILSEPSETVAPLLAQQTIQPRVEWTCFSFVHPVEETSCLANDLSS
jgi:hypothetical protein